MSVLKNILTGVSAKQISEQKQTKKFSTEKKKSYLLTLDWSISCNKFELRVKSNQSYEAQYSSVQSLSSEL